MTHPEPREDNGVVCFGYARDHRPLCSSNGQERPRTKLCWRALRIREQVFGSEHDDVAKSLYGLAFIYYEQGRYREAEPIHQQALRIREHVLGREHPDMAASLQGLALLYAEQGRYVEAKPLFERALRIWERAFGPDHPKAATSLNGLANLFRDQGGYAEANALYQRALAVREQHLGQHHPGTAQTLHDLAFLRKTQGHLSEALALAERALHIRSQSLGEMHPRTIATRELYAHLVQDQACAGSEAASERGPEGMPDSPGKERQVDRASLPLHEAIPPAPSENGPLQGFLDACCERHPRAWCRSADLWQAYKRWVQTSQERYPLSRGAFIAQLKAHGCRADRTKTARIWRGIAIVKPPTMTAGDGG